jgi:class 3 adenylate cyclase
LDVLLINPTNESIFEQRFAALETARRWSPRVLSRLEEAIRHGSDRDLFRINPMAFGARFGIAEAEAIDLFVHSSAVGLFEMDWLLLCPICACVVESFGNLKSVGDKYHCPMCRCDYESALDEFIAVTFTVSSTVRPIVFHSMQDVSAIDYCFECRMTADGLRPDGPPLAAVLRTLSHGAHYLPPNATTLYQAASERGYYFGFDMDSRAYFEYRIEGAAATESQTVRVRYSEHACEPSELTVAPGKIRFEVENITGKTGLLAICSIPPEAARTKLLFVPFLTGGRLLVTQSFRELFRSELIRAADGIGVRGVTVIFTDLKGSTALYEQIGDLKAFSLVQQHFERLLQVTIANNGAIIKTIGDAVMAAFEKPSDAVRAAISMRKEIARFNELRQRQDIVLKVGIHCGPAIVVTLNERLDYFGRTVNVAARIQNRARGDEICLSEDVHDAPGVKELLAPHLVAREQIFLKGIDREVTIFRMGVATPTKDDRVEQYYAES